MKSVGTIDMPMSAGMAVARKLNSRLDNARVLVVFVIGDEVFAASPTSSNALAAQHHTIVGTYTRRAAPTDIADDIDAWRAAA
jgi:DNA-binding LytR/AlgR family response regulator